MYSLIKEVKEVYEGSTKVRPSAPQFPIVLNIGTIANQGTYSNTINATGLSKITVTSSTYIGGGNTASLQFDFTNSYGRLNLYIGGYGASSNYGQGDKVSIYNPNLNQLTNYNKYNGHSYPGNGTTVSHTFIITSSTAIQTFTGYYTETASINLSSFFSADNGQLQIDVNNRMGGAQNNVIITLE